MQLFYDRKRFSNFLLFFCLLVLMAASGWNYMKSDDVEETIAEQSASYYEKVVALTFDDGPGYKTTMALLDGLKERDVKATFFLVGEKITERSSVIERMYEDGHLIGNHTYTHIQLDAVNTACAMDEIEKTNELILQITGEVPKYIRPPFGSWNTQLEQQINMTPVLWTLDTSDWNTRHVNQIVNYVVDNVESGDVILMHDIYDTSVVAALEIVDQLKAKGYIFVTVDDLLIE